MKELFNMSDKTYDRLKFIAQRGLPAFTAFIGVVIGCFDLALSGIVTTILSAFDGLLGELLEVASNNYYYPDGETPEEDEEVE